VTDDADAVEGAPYGIQLLGRTMKDEELLQVAQIVDEVLKGTKA
jgi:Asp-tRNA(Asn)/Glu-tRNA(Gln) amidotransferase A subunit family amidase